MKATTTTTTQAHRHANPESLSQLVCFTYRHFPGGDASQAFVVLRQRCRIFMLSLKAKDCSLLLPEDHTDRLYRADAYDIAAAALSYYYYYATAYLFTQRSQGFQNNVILSFILKAEARPDGRRSRRCLTMDSQGREHTSIKQHIVAFVDGIWSFLALYDC